MLRVRSGSAKLALIATGSMVRTAIDVADAGLDAQVWSVPSIKPLNTEQLLAIAASVDRIVTLEEHSVLGGLGSCVTEVLASSERPLPVLRIGVQDRFSERCGTWGYLQREHGLDHQSVSIRIKSFRE